MQKKLKKRLIPLFIIGIIGNSHANTVIGWDNVLDASSTGNTINGFENTPFLRVIFMKKLIYSLAFLTLITLNQIQAECLNGYIIKVIDGDTVHALINNNKTIKIRLAQIDAPEKKQAFGNRSRQELAKMIFNKNVCIVITGYDKYKRAIANIYYNGIDVNKEMVKRGLAWAYTYFVVDAELFNIENKAREEKIGLWINENPVAPWVFRKNKKTSHITY